MIYIPTQLQRQRLIQSLQNHDKQNINSQNTSNNQPQRKISKFQQEKLIQRLTVNTKKHYQIQASIKKIQMANHEIKKTARNNQKVQNRLLKEGEKIKQKKQNLAKQIEKNQRDQYIRDIPKITKVGKQVVQKPIHSRVNEIIQHKLNTNKNIEQKYKPLFEPVINPYSQFIVEIDDQGDFFQRMIKNQQKVKNKLIEKKRLIEDSFFQQNRKSSFVNKKSQMILAQKDYKQRSKSIVQNRTKKQATIQINSQPRINRKSVELLSSKPQFSQGNCFNRLYKKQKNVNYQKIRKQIQKQLTFKPKINIKSQFQAQNNKYPKNPCSQQNQIQQIFVNKQNSKNLNFQQLNDQSEQQCPRFSIIGDEKQYKKNQGFVNNDMFKHAQNQQNKSRLKFSKSQWSRITDAQV